jgi:hypothetical protein
MILIPFTPTATANPPFSAPITMDGAQYLLSSFWNLWGQRWYVSLADSSGAIACHVPLVGSPLAGPDNNLTFGVFTTNTLVYRPDTGNIEVGP